MSFFSFIFCLLLTLGDSSFSLLTLFSHCHQWKSTMASINPLPLCSAFWSTAASAKQRGNCLWGSYLCGTTLSNNRNIHAHYLPNKMSLVMSCLWKPAGTSVFVICFSQWTTGCAACNIADCIMTILNGHRRWDSISCPCPSKLQVFTKRLLGEYEDAQEHINQRANTDWMQVGENAHT